MKGRFLAENPNEMEFTLKLTASVKEFEDLREQLASKWPSSRLSMMLTDVLTAARKVYHAEKETP